MDKIDVVYMLIESRSARELSMIVTRYMEDGWSAFGSPAVSAFTDTTSDRPEVRMVFAQALVKIPEV